jgi:hypothetical protein
MCSAIRSGRSWSAQKIAGAARRVWQRAPPRARNVHYSATLLSSGLFDTVFYASQAGIRPEPDRCVAHYLKHGAAAGFSAHRLFDGAAYLGLHPDVAAAQMDPFVHFVAFGIGEGRRNRVPDSCLAQVASMPPDALRERRVSEQALAAGWRRDLPSAWRNSTVAVYASSLGNFFFRHIADRIAEGLRASGVRVYRLDQNSSRPRDATADLFVAPHEFFHLGSGPRWRDVPEVAASIMLNTEQPGTSWYFLTLRYAGPSTTLVDLSPQSALLLRDLGRSRSGYFPVGLLPDRLATAGKRPHDLAVVRGLEVLAASRRQWSRKSVGEWRDRPIDVIFLGTLTPRRSQALGRLASSLARYKCFIHAPTGRGAPLTGEKRSIGVEESLLLAGNAKVMLNLHRDEFSYFEWHRVMMMGIEQGALVLSEPCFPSPGVEAGRHFLAVRVEEMPAVLARLLESTEGEIHAKQVAELKAHELRERFDLRAELSALAFLHSKGFPQRA